jgi:hypothetical protein
VRAQLGSLDRTPLIEQQALCIGDPVERLRYLRSEMTGPVPHLPKSRHAWYQRKRHLGWVGMALILAIIPGPIPKGAAEMFARERRLTVAPASGETAAQLRVPRVWKVEHTELSELYSNGLRVDLAFAATNRPRERYPIYSLTGAGWTGKTGTSPVGIVFHTTESHIAPFEEDENRRLTQLGRNLLEVIRRDRSYHYVIDRFGRVFRVVEESEAAYHAGSSIWADAAGIYVNLNDSFLGVALEAQTEATDQVTPAQISAAKVLTEMLRSRYNISAENCVTHAQVSVNPLNMRIGAHTDWASNFPFAGLGLPDNYTIPLPSLYAFGFTYDDVFLRATGTRWKGLALAEEQVSRQAALERVPAVRYRAMLRHRYKDIAAALKEGEGGT